jgi:hypothetical protein
MDLKTVAVIGFAIMGICAGRELLAASTDAVPSQAAAVGYATNTFHSSFLNDLQNSSGNAGVNWYLDKWFTWAPTKAESLKLTRGVGITLTDGGDTSGYTIGTAASKKNPPRNWIGKAFGGGGYFEAQLKFDTTAVMKDGGIGYPAWWLEPIEHLADPRSDQWPGQESGYEHFAEIDVFEYNQWKRHPPHVYSGAVHEWYGVYRKTCTPNFCRVSNTNDGTNFNNFLIEAPQSTDFSQFHKFGFLWVPATDTTQGYLQYYFDGMATSDKITWDKFANQPPPPGKAAWTFGVIDRLHFVLILGTGNGQPMTVRSVDVWQSSPGQNLQN